MSATSVDPQVGAPRDYGHEASSRTEAVWPGPRRGPEGWAGGAGSGPGTERPGQGLGLRAEDLDTGPGRSHGFRRRGPLGLAVVKVWESWRPGRGRIALCGHSADSNLCVSFPGLGGVHPHILTCGDAENKRTR